MYDVAIVGAGPAGATLARLIGNRYKVLLIDKRRLAEDDAAYKCCGGLLAPDAQQMLSRMGLGLPRDVLTDPQLFVVRAIDLERKIERHYQRFYINMDRLEFERWLVSMVPDSVDVRLGWRFESYERTEDGFAIGLKQDGRSCIEHSRILVGADGANSRVRRQAAGDRPWPRRYFAIQEWVRIDEAMPYFGSIFDSEISDYYCWTIPKQEHLLIGAALEPNNKGAERFELLKEKLRVYGLRFGEAVRREGAFLLRPARGNQIVAAAEGIGFVGEAAGFISPSSAEGFSYAFKSAIALADVLGRSLEGFERRYRRRTRSLRRHLFVKNLKSRVIYEPFIRGLIMRTGVAGLHVRRANLSSEGEGAR